MQKTELGCDFQGFLPSIELNGCAMDDFFKRMLKESSIEPPAPLPESLHRYFPEAVSIEWHQDENRYEAIFYEDGIEKIASFDSKGALNELKVNITADELPEPVRALANERGELMNAIRIQRESKILYEIIYRDRLLRRYQILINHKGKPIWEEML